MIQDLRFIYEIKMDFTIRVTQYFDHYLNGAPAPVSMINGMPAKLKGIETGLKLDSTNSKIN
ncbi:MAG: hypothetical protein ACK4S0_05410 [Sediminibacterium sp.]